MADLLRRGRLLSARMAEGGEEKRARRPLSPLTVRILAVNVLALALLLMGVFYLDRYQQNLIAAESDLLMTQAQISAAALAEGAVSPDDDEPRLEVNRARDMLRRLVEPNHVRARLFVPSGRLLVDSRVLSISGGGVQVEELPPLPSLNPVKRAIFMLYDFIVDWVPVKLKLPEYLERPDQSASDYEEAKAALQGRVSSRLRWTDEDRLLLSVAVPVQHYKEVLGALMLSTTGARVAASMREVRLNIIRVFLVTLAVTVLLSLYLGQGIVKPIRRLAASADRVRRHLGRHHDIPDLAARDDEIGDLSVALRDMTEALWRRMDAIESFAADVSHEIKNPLTSLRSAVETAARVQDPERQKKLMAIILDDVQRLDRLITDISDASRLDSELSRAETEPVDLHRLIAALVEVYSAVPDDVNGVKIRFTTAREPMIVRGIERRLVQVMRNLISNALSFSPPGGTISLDLHRDGKSAVITIEDEGPGLPEGKLEAIFERFYTERPAGEKFGTHSGLGLSISKQIIEAHHGTITAENRLDEAGNGVGARFTVRLPRH